MYLYTFSCYFRVHSFYIQKIFTLKTACPVIPAAASYMFMSFDCIFYFVFDLISCCSVQQHAIQAYSLGTIVMPHNLGVEKTVLSRFA